MIVIIFHLFDQEFKFIALWVSRFIQAIKFARIIVNKSGYETIM